MLGLAVADSERLIDGVWTHAPLPEFAWTHSWRVGDLLIWDNRCTMHRRDAFDGASRRVMHRTQVKSEPVIALRSWGNSGPAGA